MGIGVLAIVLFGLGICCTVWVVGLRRKGVFWPLKPPAASVAAPAAASPRLAAPLSDKEELATASLSRYDPTRQRVVPISRVGAGACAALIENSPGNSESSIFSLPTAGPRSSLDAQTNMHSHTWACTKKATSVPRQRDGPRQRRLSVHPVSDEDEYSHAHTNLSSPMPFPQLSAAPPSSPFASSPHAPGGAASELMWQRTKAHQWARAKKVPSVPRQRDGPRQRRTSVHPVSDEDEYSHAHTNLRSPVSLPQLGAAAPSSPLTTSPHAPGGAAGANARKRIHGRAPKRYQVSQGSWLARGKGARRCIP